MYIGQVLQRQSKDNELHLASRVLTVGTSGCLLGRNTFGIEENVVWPFGTASISILEPPCNKNIPSKHGLFHTARLTVQALINFILYRTVRSSATLPYVQRLNGANQNFFLCLIDRTDLGDAVAWPSASARELFGLRLFLANRHGGMGIIDAIVSTLGLYGSPLLISAITPKLLTGMSERDETTRHALRTVLCQPNSAPIISADSPTSN
jgi:hypothetical protein